MHCMASNGLAISHGPVWFLFPLSLASDNYIFNIPLLNPDFLYLTTHATCITPCSCHPLLAPPAAGCHPPLSHATCCSHYPPLILLLFLLSSFIPFLLFLLLGADVSIPCVGMPMYGTHTDPWQYRELNLKHNSIYNFRPHVKNLTSWGNEQTSPIRTINATFSFFENYKMTEDLLANGTQVISHPMRPQIVTYTTWQTSSSRSCSP